MNRYIKRLAFMIPYVKRKYETGYGCPLIQQFFLVFNGRVDAENAGFSFCCEPLSDIPLAALCGTGKETIESFMAMREKILASSQSALHKGCAECSGRRRERWQNKSLIHYVNLSMYPSPCDCMCFYCDKRGRCEKTNLRHRNFGRHADQEWVET